jgi:HSP20 family protein
MAQTTNSKNININQANIWPSSEEEGELAIDLYETKDELILQAAIGGVAINDLDISITNDMITIRGRRDRDDKSKIEKFYYNECFWGPFSRSLILPQEVDADKAKATIKNGLLSIYLPKLIRVQKRTLKIEEE